MKQDVVRTAVVLVCAAGHAWADVSLPSVMSDGCVLQRETDAAIYGFGAPGEAVKVRPSWFADGDEAVEATTDVKGRWALRVSTRGVGAGPHRLDIRGNNRVVVRDVLVGEVWVCSGQSNMEWPLSASDGGEEAAKAAADAQMRLFTVPNTASLHERADTDGRWEVSSPETAMKFSAVGYHFGRELRAALDVPVGVVSADWGGTRVEAWMSDAALKNVTSVADDLAMQAKARDPVTRPTGGESLERKWWGSFDRAGAMDAAWRTPDYDDSAWKVASLPANFEGELDAFDGVVCYRKRLTLAALKEGVKGVLSLGPIDDRDEVFVNGTLVGATYDDGLWSRPRTYEVPEGVLRQGENVIAVAVLDTAGPGGIFGEPGEMSLGVGNERVALAGEWRYSVGAPLARLPEKPAAFEVSQNSPGVLYRGMIAPLTRHTVGGFLWYQGESNRNNAVEYATLFPAMIGDWRRAFGQSEAPFYFAQIAPYRHVRDRGQTAMLREAQAKALDLPHTGMVVTMDIGDPSDIHPRDKRTVGKRFADIALTDMGVLTDPALTNYPTPLRTKSAPDGVMVVEYNIASGELAARGGALAGFEVAGEDRCFFPALTAIRGNTVEVWSASVPSPVAVRYGFCNDCEPTLMSRAGLPAVPFRTDAWSLGEWTRDQEAEIAHIRGREPGFVSLFDGTLDGWTSVNTFDSTWIVKHDGRGKPIIHCTGTPTGVLRTNEQYENFVLEMEWRHLEPRSNAGLFVWSDALPVRGQPFTRSVEVQVMDGMEGPGYSSDGDVFPIHGAVMTPLTRPSGSRAMPLQRRANPSPMWNHYRVECINGELSLAVNGTVVTRGKDISPRRGYVCLESEGGPVDFRNIRLKKLPDASPAIGPELIAEQADGFVPLLSDRSLSQWDMSEENAKHWVMDNWVLKYDGKGANLQTRKEYRNYELIADWRFPGKAKEDKVPAILPDGSAKVDAAGNVVTEAIKNAGDSGIYLRGTERSQVNMWCWPVGSGELWDVRNDRNAPAEVRAAATPKERADAHAGQWNRFRIRLVGDRVTVDLNGTRVIEDAQIPGINERGPILLQHHGGAVEWANLYVKELD